MARPYGERLRNSSLNHHRLSGSRKHAQRDEATAHQDVTPESTALPDTRSAVRHPALLVHHDPRVHQGPRDKDRAAAGEFPGARVMSSPPTDTRGHRARLANRTSIRPR